MKVNYWFLILIITLLISGCENSERENLIKEAENLGYLSETCEVKKIFPSDCVFLKNKKKEMELNLKLFISKYQIEEKVMKSIIRDAYELGKLKVEGSSSDSVYSRVYRAYKETPYYFDLNLSDTSTIELADLNYGVFSPKCSELKDENFYQRFATLEADPMMFPVMNIVIFNKLEGSCFSIDKLQDDYTILSEKQLKKYASIRQIKVLKYDSWDEANVALEGMK